MQNKVSLREYARIRGVHLNAVQTAIKNGRIFKTSDGKINVEQANKDWFMNTDQSKSRKIDPLMEDIIKSSGDNKQNHTTFQQAKTADIFYRAMTSKEKLRILKGEYINKKQAKGYTYDIAKALVDLILSFSVRYGSLIAAELKTDEHKTAVVIDEYIRELLSASEDIINREL